MTIVLSDKLCKAKKRHICDECLNEINAGESYHNQCNIYEGDLGVWKSHVECREIALFLNKDSYSDEWHPLHDHPKEDIDRAKKEMAEKK